VLQVEDGDIGGDHGGGGDDGQDGGGGDGTNNRQAVVTEDLRDVARNVAEDSRDPEV
jgi:hypothetical protein